MLAFSPAAGELLAFMRAAVVADIQHEVVVGVLRVSVLHNGDVLLVVLLLSGLNW